MAEEDWVADFHAARRAALEALRPAEFVRAAFCARTTGVELGPLRYDRVVEAMGGLGVHVTHPADPRPAIARPAKSGAVTCIDVDLQGLASPLTQANVARHRRGRDSPK